MLANPARKLMIDGMPSWRVSLLYSYSLYNTRSLMAKTLLISNRSQSRSGSISARRRYLCRDQWWLRQSPCQSQRFLQSPLSQFCSQIRIPWCLSSAISRKWTSAAARLRYTLSRLHQTIPYVSWWCCPPHIFMGRLSISSLSQLQGWTWMQKLGFHCKLGSQTQGIKSHGQQAYASNLGYVFIYQLFR